MKSIMLITAITITLSAYAGSAWPQKLKEIKLRDEFAFVLEQIETLEEDLAEVEVEKKMLENYDNKFPAKAYSFAGENLAVLSLGLKAASRVAPNRPIKAFGILAGSAGLVGANGAAAYLTKGTTHRYEGLIYEIFLERNEEIKASISQMDPEQRSERLFELNEAARQIKDEIDSLTEKRNILLGEIELDKDSQY